MSQHKLNLNTGQMENISSSGSGRPPIKGYYTQYPVPGAVTINDMFPIDESPAALYGGTWTEMYDTEDVFFRTGALGSRRGQRWTGSTWASDGEEGIEPDATRAESGSFESIWQGYVYGSVRNPSGVFGVNGRINNAEPPAMSTAKMNLDFGINFDNARVVPTDTNIHPKNRLVKIWKHTA